jgi:hypothetical protein
VAEKARYAGSPDFTGQRYRSHSGVWRFP